MTSPHELQGTAVREGLIEGIDPLSAVAELDGHSLRTPVRRLPFLEKIVGVPVWAKLEFQQHTGSFKYRGAYLATRHAPDMPVIAASAGNHGLAVAEVTRQLGRPANICVPTVASRLKRERILATGAGVIEFGNSLEDATRHARELASAHGLHYISPYNNPHVIAGSSTVALEFLNQVPSLQTIIAPVGGGGFISGLGIGAATTGRTIELKGCAPKRYGPVVSSLAAQKIVRVVHQPTFADGLAVNLEPDSITFPLIQRYVSDIVTLSEEELAAGTLALLMHESILVEPAGAAGVIACLRFASQGEICGPIGIPLCGGNIQHSALTRIQRFPYTDPELVSLLDLHGRKPEEISFSFAQPYAAARAERSLPADPGLDQAKDMAAQLHAAKSGLHDAQASIKEHVDYCRKNGLQITEPIVDLVADTSKRAIARVTDEYVALCNLEQQKATGPGDLVRAEATLRYALACLAHVRGALEWCSPSYAQSGVIQFFDTGSQDAPTVNYERYESAPVREIEKQLLAVLDLRPDRHTVTVTSSGQAAYSLIEGFLLRYRLQPGDTILLAPYIYFEASEQLSALPYFRFVRAPGYSVDEILAAAKQYQPRCLFIDPIANTAEQRVIDIADLINRLRAGATHPITVVIDGTMVSGGLPAEVLDSDEKVEVIYYESCSKYLQLGLDAGMAGMVVTPVALGTQLDRLRRNAGAILYRHYATLFPRYGPDLFRRRMSRISANALRTASRLIDDKAVNDEGVVYYAGHDSHPDVAAARKLAYTGGCVTFVFHEPGRNHHSELDALIDHMLAIARQSDLQLTKGVSFGFSVPRVSAAASMAESERPFLRLYAGDRGLDQADLLAEITANAIINAR
jgi:threonine dehydratase